MRSWIPCATVGEHAKMQQIPRKMTDSSCKQMQGKWYKNRIPKTNSELDPQNPNTVLHPTQQYSSHTKIAHLLWSICSPLWRLLTSASSPKGARASRCSLPWSWFLMQLLLGSEQKLGKFYFQLGFLERAIGATDFWGSAGWMRDETQLRPQWLWQDAGPNERSVFLDVVELLIALLLLNSNGSMGLQDSGLRGLLSKKVLGLFWVPEIGCRDPTIESLPL